MKKSQKQPNLQSKKLPLDLELKLNSLSKDLRVKVLQKILETYQPQKKSL